MKSSDFEIMRDYVNKRIEKHEHTTFNSSIPPGRYINVEEVQKHEEMKIRELESKLNSVRIDLKVAHREKDKLRKQSLDFQNALDQVYEKEFKECINAAERAYEKWTAKEVEQLRYELDFILIELAKNHKRSPRSIRYQIIDQGLITKD